MATISRLSVDLVANSAKFKKDLNSASKSAKKSFGSMMKSAKLATAAFAAVGAALGGALLSSAKVYGNFTEALQDVKAKTGATANQLDELSVSMRNAAKATRFTATQTAEAGTFLAQAGFNIKEINDSLRPTLDLAAATKTSVQNTADFMTNILKGMGMTTDEVQRATDVLAVTTAKSNTNLTDLAEAMKEAAPSARAFGMSIEETSSLLGSMANAGIKGSRAGISLRASFAALSSTGSLTETMLANSTGQMTTQTKALRRLGVHTKTAEGDMRNLVTILHELKAAGGDEQDMIAIFGRRAGSALMQFMNEGLEGADALKLKLDGARGAAEKMAAVQMNSLNGDILLFRSQFEELQMVIAENGINDLFRGITQSATKFMKSAEPALASLAKYADEVAVGLLAFGGVLVMAGIMKLIPAMALLTKTMLLNPIFLMAVAFTAFAVYAYRNIEEVTFYWKRFVKNMGIFADNIVGLLTTAWSNIGTNFDIMIVGFLLGLERFKKGFIDALNYILSKMNPAVNKLIEMYNAIPFMDDVKPVTLNIDTDKMSSKIKGLTDQMVALVASKNSFTQTALDDSPFIPSDKPVVDGGAGIDDVETPESKAQSELEAEAARLEALRAQEMKYFTDIFNMKKGFYDSTTALATGSWEDIIDGGAKGSKKLLMIQKASALKQVAMSMYTGIGKALELPFPASLLAGVKVAAAGAIQLSNIKGQFHDGIDNVPNTGTYLLESGERVVDKRLNKDMSQFLADQNGGGGNTTNNNPTLNFNVSGGDAENVERMLMNHRGKFEGMIRDIYAESAQNAPF